MVELNEKALEAAVPRYSEGGCMGLADHERREVVIDIITAYLSSIPSSDRANEARLDAEQQVQKLTAENERLREALTPFANTADHDIGTDESDSDIFRPMTNHNSALRITVGDMRRALAALETQEGGE